MKISNVVFHNKKIKTLFTLSITALIAIPAAVLANHTWSNYHWARTSNPMPLQVINSVTSDWQGELDISLAEWNQSVALDMSITSSDNSRKTRKRCTAVTGQIKVCNASYGFNGWLGLASINIDSSGHITQGTAKMNDSYSSSWTDPNEKRHVMCQEVGHLFGLGHTSEDGSSQGTCMDYSQDPNSISPNAHDYDLLSQIYGHNDTYNTYDDGGTGGGSTPCRGGPKKCGSNAGATNGNSDFGKGHRIRGNEFYEQWVEYHDDGSMTLYHVTLVR